MPIQTWTPGQILTATELTSVTNMLLYPTATSVNVNPCVAGNYYVCTATVTMTLPAPTAGLVVGFKLRAASGTVTINRNSADTIYYSGGSGVTSVVISDPEDYILLVADGTNWHERGAHLSGPGTLLAVTSYTATVTKTTTSATNVAVDSTNLKATVVVPPNGKLLCRLTAQAYQTTGGAQYWCILNNSGGTLLGNAAIITTNTSSAAAVPYSLPFYITGLTAGASVQLNWGWRVSANTGNMLIGDGTGTGNGPAVMEVWSAP